jgi:hypothetical protein
MYMHMYMLVHVCDNIDASQAGRETHDSDQNYCMLRVPTIKA